MNNYLLISGLMFMVLAVFHETFRPPRLSHRGEDGTLILGFTSAILIICAIVSIWV